jgi:hypothetical protein
VEQIHSHKTQTPNIPKIFALTNNKGYGLVRKQRASCVLHKTEVYSEKD